MHSKKSFRTWFVVLSFVMALTLAASLATAATLTVDAAGSTAYKTIASAASAAAAGDTVTVNAGTYNERVNLSKSGTSSAPITFQASGTVVMNGFSINANYVKVIGFEVTGTKPQTDEGAGIYMNGTGNEARNNYVHETAGVGIKFSDSASSSLISGNKMYRCAWNGAEAHGTNNIIEYNDISHSLQHAPAANGYWDSGSPDADGMRYFGSGHIIRYNHIHDITMADPENQTPHIDCFQTWGPATNITFDGNYCHGGPTQAFMNEASSGTDSGLVIINNVFDTDRGPNIWDAANTTLANNIFVGGSTYGIELHRSPNSVVKNNISYNRGSSFLYIDASDGTAIANNLIYNPNGSNASSSSTDIVGKDPMFVNAAGGDYHLKAGSPAIDAGVAVAAVKDDMGGGTRPVGSAMDIGAYEYGSTPSTTPTPSAPGAPQHLRIATN